jgi:hypothetical protein
MKCEIIESEYIMNSDHNIVIAKLSTGIMQRTRALASVKRLKGKKKILRLNKAQKEN